MRVSRRVVVSLVIGLALVGAADDLGAQVPRDPGALGTLKTGVREFVIRNGVYRDQRLTIKAGGTALEPLLIRAETPGGVVFEGRSSIELRGDWVTLEGVVFRHGWPSTNKGAIVVQGSHDRITGCRIEGFNKHPEVTPDDLYETKWVSLETGTVEDEVDHCVFTGKRDRGALLVVWRQSEGENRHRIHDNLFQDFAAPPGSLAGEPGLPTNWRNEWETLRVGTRAMAQGFSRTIVEDNTFDRCSGEVEIISNKSSGNIYRRNTFLSCRGLLTLRNGTDCLVQGNVFRTEGLPGAGGIRIVDRNHRIEDNLIVGVRLSPNKEGSLPMGGGLVIMASDPAQEDYRTVDNLVVRNNRLVDCEGSFVFGTDDASLTGAPGSVLFQGNRVWAFGTGGQEYPVFLIVPGRRPRTAVFQDEVYLGASLGLEASPPGVSFSRPVPGQTLPP